MLLLLPLLRSWPNLFLLAVLAKPTPTVVTQTTVWSLLAQGFLFYVFPPAAPHSFPWCSLSTVLGQPAWMSHFCKAYDWWLSDWMASWVHLFLQTSIEIVNLTREKWFLELVDTQKNIWTEERNGLRLPDIIYICITISYLIWHLNVITVF